MGRIVYTSSAPKGFQVIDLEAMSAKQKEFLEKKGVLKKEVKKPKTKK